MDISEATKQKPPKFKVGDWVINKSSKKVNQIVKVDDDGDGFTLDDDTYFSGSWANGYRLWTFLVDARPGDILIDLFNKMSEPPLIFMFKDASREQTAFGSMGDYHSYCFLKANPRHDFEIGSWHNEHCIKPATKDQKELLLKKMYEAGYEFDYDKMELKKIETNEDLSDDKMIQLIIDDIHCGTDFNANEMHNANKREQWFKDFIRRKSWKPSEKQMEVLGAVSRGYVYDYDIITSLYNDLKKL